MIDLGENQLTGKLPTWIGNSLVKLVVLIIRSNNFNHTIHPNLCTLQHIQVLDLSINNLSGTIPKCLHNLTAMTEELNLYPFFVYYIELPILTSLMTKYTSFFDFEYLMWKGNEVKYINVALRLVKLIDLSSNKLSGEIPPKITKLVGLIGLNISRNNLTGSIPKNIGNLNSLNFLDFSRNYLFGNIPQR
ncbi:hypothetical protein ACJIZ3_009058 [Penstemon smallii]|uniref:Uncharacterized protein n=1 Tax=Penstemon smallii TaxID=265156 RepID=A0ABD3TDD0_9LAMI